MNRLEMAEQVAQRVPLLAKRDKEEWKSVEKLRIGFVADYPISRICVLTLDEYVIGKGSDSRSFCYRLEREMDSLGRILGATAFKFGVYFGRTKSDPLEQYRFRSHWGSNLEESFSSVKDAIADLLRAAAKGDAPAIAKNPLSPMVKGKLLFVYNPEKFAPIYSTEHLKHFIAELDLSGSFDCGADMQRALMDYRATWPDLQAQPVPLYMRLLYDLFGYPPDNESRTATPASVPLLDEAVKGAKLIQQMPAPSGKSNLRAQSIGKTDYEVHQKQLKRIGDRGEAIVFALKNSVCSKLANLILPSVLSIYPKKRMAQVMTFSRSTQMEQPVRLRSKRPAPAILIEASTSAATNWKSRQQCQTTTVTLSSRLWAKSLEFYR